MNDALTFSILRLLTLIPSVILTIVQGKIMIKRWNNKDKMRPYRLLLFLFTLAFTVDNGIVLYGDLLKYFFQTTHGQTFSEITGLRYLSRVLELITIYYFYRLIYVVKNDKND
jgi:uncharacterized membrane protein